MFLVELVVLRYMSVDFEVRRKFGRLNLRGEDGKLILREYLVSISVFIVIIAVNK